MKGVRSVAQVCAVKRSSSTKNASGERVLNPAVTVVGLEAVPVGMTPASQYQQLTLNQRGIVVTHQIVFPNGAGVMIDDLLEIAGSQYLVRNVAVLPRAVTILAELSRGVLA